MLLLASFGSIFLAASLQISNNKPVLIFNMTLLLHWLSSLLHFVAPSSCPTLRWKGLGPTYFPISSTGIIGSLEGIYKAIQAPLIDRQRRELAKAYMETLIPEPTPTNVRKFKKGLWRKTTPKGLKLKKFIEGPDGTLVHDSSFVGEDAYDDDDHPWESVKEIIDQDVKLNKEEKKVLEEDLTILGENQESRGTWRERLQAWNEILQKDKLAEQLDSLNARYVVEFDMKEVENSLRKDVLEKVKNNHGNRA
ncbi:unnamed protein product, partial [Coffea canephora]